VKKTGEEAPMSEKIVATVSIQEFRYIAARIPSGIAISSEIMKLIVASCSVIGSRSMMSFRTSCRCRNDRPRFPCSRSTTQSRYCVCSGLSSR